MGCWRVGAWWSIVGQKSVRAIIQTTGGRLGGVSGNRQPLLCLSLSLSFSLSLSVCVCVCVCVCDTVCVCVCVT